jgi:CDP-glucose 4,6-dehydratase
MAKQQGSMEGVGLNRSFWTGKRVLVTGCTGFKGSWLTLWLQQLGATVIGLGLPPEPQGIFSFLEPWRELEFSLLDIRERPLLNELIEKTEPEVVFHLAAQSLVQRGYREPLSTYETNIGGTLNILEACSNFSTVRAVLITTTDKVYENSGDGTVFNETHPLGGADPYSSSKACTELIARAWRDSYGARRDQRIATARAGNVIGGGDTSQDRLLPDLLKAIARGGVAELRSPDSVRPWQFVLEPLLGYILFVERLWESDEVPMALNFGPSDASELRVRDIADLTVKAAGCGSWVSTDPLSDTPEKPYLRLDSNLAHKTLGWKTRLSASEAIQWTVDWFKAQQDTGDMRRICLDQLSRYETIACR